MSQAGGRVLIVLATAAVLVGVVDGVGWLWWQRTSRTLESNASHGADRLLYGRSMALPTTAQLSRRLDHRSLAAAPTSLVVGALERVSRHQKRWLWADPCGFENAAVAALVSQRMEDGLQHLRGAMARDPTSPRLRRLTALVLKRAVELAPDDPSLAARLVDFHLRQREFTDAAMRLSAALDRFPTDQRLLSQAERLRREVGQPGR